MAGGKRADSYLARIILCTCLVVCTVFLCPVRAGAASQDEETVRVGYYENEVFQEGAQEGAVKTGYAYEYYQKISGYTGWRYEYEYGEFGDLYQMLLDGKIDLLAGLARTEERESIIGYPDAAMGNETYNLVKHDDDDDITAEPATLSGRKIGVLDSAMADVLRNYLDNNGVQAEVVTFRDYEPLFAAFDDHEIDVLAAEGDGAYGRSSAELVCSFGASNYYLCVSKTRPDILGRLNTAQSELAADEPNYISALKGRYYPVSISSRAFSEPEREWLASHDELRVGYLNNYIPYSDTDGSGEVTGVVKDIVPQMLEELDIKDLSVSYESFESYDDMTEALGEGRIDTAFPVGGGLYYSEENGILQSGPVVSAATELVFRGVFSEEKTKHFAVNENNRMQYYFIKTHYPDAEITAYPSIDACLKAVMDGKAGCTTLNGLRADDILRNSRYSGLSLLQTTHDDDRCFGVRTGNEGLLKLLNRGINVLGADYAQNLAYHYTDQLYTYSFSDMVRDNAVLFGLMILAVAGIIIGFLFRDRKRSSREISDKENARRKLEEVNEKLVEQQMRREQQDKMITALASDYRCVYHVDLDNNDAVCYRADPNDQEQTPEGVHFPYMERFSWYGENYVAESYREGFLSFIDPEHIRRALESEPIIAYRYLVQRNGREYYEMIRMAGVRHAKNRDDHIVHAIGLGLTVIDTEMRDTMAKNQALIEALGAAEEANRAKTAFLSNMSHEIRTPMNAIIGLDSLALNNDGIPAETREYLEKISESASHLLNIINDILDMSRIEAGRLVLHREEFSFREMLDQINTMVMTQCADKGLRYECKVSGEISDYYIGDVMKLKQVLINILSNAVKFTDPPGEVTLSVERTAEYEDHSAIRFRIKDTGVGMDKSFVPRIFDPFTQEDSSRNSKYGSTGLGMAITKSIVELMNGTISVESEKGAGTVFTVVVTLTNSKRAAVRDGRTVSKTGGTSGLKGRHILMAEDVIVNAEIMKKIIQAGEAEIDHAENGSIAVDMFRSSPPGYYDAILMDIRMPEMDGLEAAKAIRALDRPDAGTVPIIALTANAFDEDVQRSLQAGMNAHLSKPIEPDRLYRTLEELI